MKNRYSVILGNLGNTRDRFMGGGYKSARTTAEMLAEAASIRGLSGVELVGTWDDAAKALSLTATDDSVTVREVFPGDDRSEFQITFKNKGGEAVRETKGVTRRVPPTAVAPSDAKREAEPPDGPKK